MTLPPGFRFYTPADPLVGRTTWVLEHVYQLSVQRIAGILTDPQRRILLRVDDSGALAGFVVFNDYKPRLLLPENAFISAEDKQLVASEGLSVYSFEQIWWRDEEYGYERIVREVFAVMSDTLVAEAKRHALLALLSDAPENDPLRALLQEIGFRPRPNAYQDYRLPLRLLPPIGGDLRAPLPGFTLHTFEDPLEPEQLARTFNRVFAGGRSEIDAGFVSETIRSPSFSRGLSLWIEREGRVAAFGWVHRPAPDVADLQLIGTDPDFRGQGLIKRATPAFLSACQDQGITTVTFSIEGHNQAPLALAGALGITPFQTRHMLMRVR